MTKSKKNNFNYKRMENKKKYYKTTRKNDGEIKKSLLILSNLRTNFYQRIYMLVNTQMETWKQFEYLSSDKKIEDFISKINNEIEKIKNNNFNFDKYREAILSILGINSNNLFNNDIIKNMYIAKLQNVIFILQSPEEGGNNQEVKENKTISR